MYGRSLILRFQLFKLAQFCFASFFFSCFLFTLLFSLCSLFTSEFLGMFKSVDLAVIHCQISNGKFQKIVFTVVTLAETTTSEVELALPAAAIAAKISVATVLNSA